MASREPTDFSKLIPELPNWNNGEGIDVDSWLTCMGSFQLAIAFSNLFWPDFVEHDGCILFADFSLDNYAAFISQRKGNRAAVEWVMNHRHILDFFCNDAAYKSATAEQLLYLGRILKDIWQTKLARDFPGREIIVSFEEGPYKDLIGYQITFWQRANEPAK